MKSPIRFVVFGVLLAALAVSVGMSAFGDDDEKVTLAQVPAAVRATIEQQAVGATIKEIEKETEKGRVIYSVEMVRNGQKLEFEVAADGTFLGMEKDDDEGEDEKEAKISLSETPLMVQSAIRTVVGGNPVTEVVKETEKGCVTYEVVYAVNGVEHSASFAAAGDLLELEKGVDANRLPAAILRRLQAKYPAATIKAAETVQVFYYEVELVVNGKKREVEISATGEILDGDDDEDEDNDD